MTPAPLQMPQQQEQLLFRRLQNQGEDLLSSPRCHIAM